MNRMHEHETFPDNVLVDDSMIKYDGSSYYRVIRQIKGVNGSTVATVNGYERMKIEEVPGDKKIQAMLAHAKEMSSRLLTYIPE